MELTTLVLQVQANMRADIESAKHEVLREIAHVREETAALKQAQLVANGRTTKLEKAHARLRTSVAGLSQKGSLVGALTPAQKAKIAGGVVIAVGALVEGLHRGLPILISLLARWAGVPVPGTPS